MNFQVTDWESDFKSLTRIRNLVFIQEQNVPIADEWDEYDKTATHFLVKNSQSESIACARVLTEEDQYHIGRVAVLNEFRNQTVGRQLMQFILRWCNHQEPDFTIYLHAQTNRRKFYEYLGFVAEGDVFMDAGIEHVEMWYRC